MGFKIEEAKREGLYFRCLITGGPGFGKTRSALAVASGLGKNIVGIDTQRRQMRRYGHLYSYRTIDLDQCGPSNYCHPQNFIDAINAAVGAGADVIIVDSFSHAWSGPGGALELVDSLVSRNEAPNSFAAWRIVTPLCRRLNETLAGCPAHVIATSRTRTEWTMEADDRGKMHPRKHATEPEQRKDIEYEFDVVGVLDAFHTLNITKDNAELGLQGQTYPKPGPELGELILARLADPTFGPHHVATPAAQADIRPAPPAPKAKAPRPIDWTKFWEVTERLDLTPEEVCEIGEVGTIEDFMALDSDRVRSLNPALQARAKANKEAAA